MSRRLVGGVLVALLSAVLLILIWPVFGNLWWLSVVAFVPMYVAQYRVLPRRRSALAVAIAFGAYYFAGFHNAGTTSLWIAAIGIGVGAAVLGYLIGMFLRPFTERTGYRWFIVTLPLLWVTIDLFLKNNKFLGSHMWLGHRLAPAPELVQPVSITGTPALSLLLHVVNAALALVLIALIDRARPGLATVGVAGPTLRWSVMISVAAVAIWVIVSLLLFREVPHPIQPGGDGAVPWTENAPLRGMPFQLLVYAATVLLVGTMEVSWRRRKAHVARRSSGGTPR